MIRNTQVVTTFQCAFNAQWLLDSWCHPAGQNYWAKYLPLVLQQRRNSVYQALHCAAAPRVALINQGKCTVWLQPMRFAFSSKGPDNYTHCCYQAQEISLLYTPQGQVQQMSPASLEITIKAVPLPQWVSAPPQFLQTLSTPQALHQPSANAEGTSKKSLPGCSVTWFFKSPSK